MPVAPSAIRLRAIVHGAGVLPVARPLAVGGFEEHAFDRQGKVEGRGAGGIEAGALDGGVLPGGWGPSPAWIMGATGGSLPSQANPSVATWPRSSRTVVA